MAYNEFTIDKVRRDFGLSVARVENLFAEVPSVAVPPSLGELLEEYVPLATLIQTEKARSEFILAPILAEVRKLKRHQVSLFSGIAFDVDRSKGLNGTCDFLLALSPLQFALQAPVLAVVEAKNEDLNGGLGQCLAEMVAARIFNENSGRAAANIHGVVTTGSLWRFLKLSGDFAWIDQVEYHLGLLGKILGILLHCVETTEQNQ